MANSKLLLSVDDLSHKLLSIETEVAVGETFDLILDGLAGVSTGSKVVVGLYSLSGGLLWTLDSPLSLIDDTHYGVANCKINTQEAAKVVRLTSAVTILTLVIHAEDGKQTVYGSAYLRLHQGYAEDGESVGKAITSLEQHNADETAHPAIRKLVDDFRNEVLRTINKTMLQHGNSEVEARNQAISHAIKTLDAELTSRYKGDLTFFATACAASSKAAAASAKVSAEASELTVNKLVEANNVVKELRDSLTEAGEKLNGIDRAIKDANDVANSLKESRDLIVNAKDTVVDKVKEFNTTLETFNGEFVQDKQTIKDSVTAVTNAKNYFDEKLPTIEKAEDYAKEAKSAKEAAQTANDEAKETTEANQSLTLSSSESAVQALESATRAEEAAFGKTDESGNVVKDGAKQFAEQAEQAKTAIGDVGKRFDAVEASVGEKLPYFSPFLKRFFDVRVGNFKMRSVDCWIQIHEGFLMRDVYSTAKDRLLIPALNQVVQVDSFGAIRISVIEDNKTTIYSYSGSTLYKTTVSGSGEGLSYLRETITAMPTAVEALSNVVGYKTANGFVVCTQGHILSADLETEVATFYAVKTYREIVKNGEEFYFYDGAVKKFATITLADDGTPSVTHNSYTQTDATFYPITKTMHVKRSSIGAYIGSTADGYGYLYRESGLKGLLYGVIRFRFLRSRFRPLLCLDGKIFLVVESDTNDSMQRIFEVARGLYGDFEYKGDPRSVFAYDTRGNNLLSYLSYYNNDDPNQYYYLLSSKEVWK